MYTSTEVDRLEQQYTRSGEAFFHVAGRGHESVAALNPHLIPEDWLSCHYRSKALMLARGLSVRALFAGFFARDSSPGRGRQMSAHTSCPELHMTSLVGPVGNNALQAVGIAAEIEARPGRPISVCCLGEGTTQQGEVLEALQEAARGQLPVLFLIEDNGWAISTPTRGRTFYTLSGRDASEYCGIPISYVDGSDTVACYDEFGEVVARIRQHRRAEIVVMRTQRLSDHTNADDQTIYRSAADIDNSRDGGCPVGRLEAILVGLGLAGELESLKASWSAATQAAAEEAYAGADPQPCRDAAFPLAAALTDPAQEYLGYSGGERLTMIDALRAVLEKQLASSPRVSLYGQDIEDPKGDVFGLTRGLSSRFPEQVKNAPLSESTIVGTAVGRALAGGKPVALIQFSDFLPLAFNQICSEISTMYWRTDGGWQCPVIILAPCGGYRAGLGHFHAQSFESMFAHIPGIDVMVPSGAADAAGLLNAAFKSNRPTLFFYPKASLNDRKRTTSIDISRHLASIGRARIVRSGSDLTMIVWGNTVERAIAAAQMLAEEGKSCEIIDLRCIAPWDKAAVIRSAEKTGRLLVIHENGHTCGMGAEILATVWEALGKGVECRRLTRPDTHIPCNFANQLEILPSIKTTLEAAASMLGMAVSWEEKPVSDGDIAVIEAVGASPSDESVTINAWRIAVGETVSKGDLLVEYEADKAVTELLCPYSGTVERLLVKEGETAKVGAPVMWLRVDDPNVLRRMPLTREELTAASISSNPVAAPAPAARALARNTLKVGIKRIATSCGSMQVSNDEILKDFADKSSTDIVRATGIESRPRVVAGETALSLAVAACEQLLGAENLCLGDIDTLICATGTPDLITPSTACQVMAAIDSNAECAAYDLSAACSGYLYALQNAYDILQSNPKARVLIVTTEVLSPLLDASDYTTAILFGDAATASLICGEAHLDGCSYELRRPMLSAQGDTRSILSVPHSASGATISMDGTRVFSLGVRKMAQSLKRMLDNAHLSLDELDLIIPHQANLRIITAIIRKMGIPDHKVFTNIRDYGNTSSNTIPLALGDVLAGGTLPAHVALTAFGGGFTYGACILYRSE